MSYVNLLDFKTKILKELDLEEDSLIKSDELSGFIHDGVKFIVAAMMKFGNEDRYYTSYSEISLVSGQSSYDLPTDCYAQKIYYFCLVRSQMQYPLRRVRGMREFEKIVDSNLTYSGTTNTEFKYFFKNTGPLSGVKIEIIPTPRESIASGLKMYYFREPVRASLDADLIDIPEEFIKLLEIYAKCECLKKDVGNPMLPVYLKDLADASEAFENTFTEQTLDKDTALEMDMRFYEDSI